MAALRTYDVVAFQVPPTATIESNQKLWELNGIGSAVTGIMKLAQHVLLELLTVKGSRPFDKKSGTSFLTFVRQGYVTNEVDANVYFQYAVAELQQTLAARERVGDPLDECFANLTVLSLTFTPLQLSYSLQLTSQAGTTRQLILPVTTLT